MRAVTFALLAVATVACRSPEPPSPYVRITATDGRLYYAEHINTLHLSRGVEEGEPGYLTFRDLVTRETVKLQNGTYQANLVPVQEIEVRQREYLDNPDKPPRVQPGDPIE